MYNHHRVGTLASLLVAIGAIAGCSSSSSPSPTGTDTTTTPPAPSQVTIQMAHNDWQSANLNDQVAKILLEEKMTGVTVNFVPATTAGQWASIAKGDLHVSLEVWPSGHPDNIKNDLGKDVENGGLLGPIAKVGWFVPTYVLNDHPELATWEGYKTASNASLFSTVTTGTKGRFLGGDPKWVQYDQEIIDNLGLNFQVEFAGSEDAELAELDTAYQKRQPIIFYLWEPHWSLAKYDLTMVRLPDYTDACWASGATNGINCDYPADHLLKIMWPGLKDYAPKAYQFLKNMNYTTLDQINMMANVSVKGMTVDQSARDWIAKNEAVWSKWIPQ